MIKKNKKISKNIKISIWTLVITLSTTIAGFSMIQAFEKYGLSPLWGVSIGAIGVIIGTIGLFRLNKN